MHSERPSRAVRGILVVVLLFGSLSAGTAIVSGETEATEGQIGIQDTAVKYQQTPRANNSTVVHENPQNVTGTGDQQALRQWLEDRMTEVVIDCTEQMKVGGSFTCDRLDERYPEWASRYVDLRGDRGSPDGQSTGETLNQTRRDVRQLSTEVQRFRELEAEYEAAKAAGDEQRVRELAHELVRQSRRINNTGSRVSEDYEAFAETTSANLTVASEAVSDIQTNTSARAREVRDVELVQTQLTATATTETGSFSSPLVVEGALVATSGGAIRNRTVRFQIGNGTVTTEVGSDGQFSFGYRPINEMLGRQQLSVSYIPSNESLYARSSDEVTATIEPATADLSTSTTQSVVGFGDTLQVSGRVRVNDRQASGVPVVLSLGGERLGTATTGESGYYTLNASLPETVSAGNTRIVAGLSADSRALSATEATVPIQIESTRTKLSIRGSRVAPRVASINGQLRANGEPVTDRSVTLSYDGRTLATVRTDDDGQFTENLSLPATVSGQDPVTISAVHGGEGTHLQSARTGLRLGPSTGGQQRLLDSLLENPFSVLFTQPAGSSDVNTLETTNSLDLVLQIGAVIIALSGGIVLVWLFKNRSALQGWSVGLRNMLRSLLPWTDGPSRTTGSSGGDKRREAASQGSQLSDSSASESLDLVAVARDRMATGETDEAVIMGYEAVRTSLVDRLNRDTSMTHWELLRAYASDGATEKVDALRQLTEAYERSAFSLETSSLSSTKTALAGAVFLLEDLEPSGRSDLQSDSSAD